MTTDDPSIAGSTQPQQNPKPGSAGANSDAALETLTTLAAVLRRMLGAWRDLVASEGRLAFACVPLLFIGALALVAFCISLWAVLVALAGWLLLQVTQSLGIALGLLAAIHVVLVVAAWVCVRYWLRQTTFPRTRAELRALGATIATAVPPDAGQKAVARHSAQDDAQRGSA